MADTWLEGPVTSAAYGWRLERRDGVTIGFTSHDRDVETGGLLYRASPGLVPTSIAETAGFDSDGLEVQGALTADALRADDLRAGKWDGAELEIFLFDWSNPLASRRILATGLLGAIEYSSDCFSVDIAGPAARLAIPVAPFTSPTCRATFCGKDCGMSAARFRHRVKVETVVGSSVRLAGLPLATASWFASGELRWLGGANCGLRQSILSASADSILLDRAPAFAISAGTSVELFEGCDKTLATCAARFGNAVNFRGEPHLPGNDLLMRYPAA